MALIKNGLCLDEIIICATLNGVLQRLHIPSTAEQEGRTRPNLLAGKLWMQLWFTSVTSTDFLNFAFLGSAKLLRCVTQSSEGFVSFAPVLHFNTNLNNSSSSPRVMTFTWNMHFPLIRVRKLPMRTLRNSSFEMNCKFEQTACVSLCLRSFAPPNDYMYSWHLVMLVCPWALNLLS